MRTDIAPMAVEAALEEGLHAMIGSERSEPSVAIETYRHDAQDATEAAGKATQERPRVPNDRAERARRAATGSPDAPRFVRAEARPDRLVRSGRAQAESELRREHAARAGGPGPRPR
jgi:hypothetical protein